jgi:NAD(P)H dehydrogenase (quinone)
MDLAMSDHATATRMKHAVILCHPKADSFNASLAKRYCETVSGFGHEAVLRDLYRIGFDPVLKAGEEPHDDFIPAPDVAAELAAIDGADVLVLVYPLWFGMPPAMLKGYVDRVLGAGFSFRSVRDHGAGHMLADKRLVSITTSGTNRAWLEEQGAWLSLRNLFDDYLRHAFSMRSTEHHHYSSIVEGLKRRFVDENLYDVEQKACALCGRINAESRDDRNQDPALLKSDRTT